MVNEGVAVGATLKVEGVVDSSVPPQAIRPIDRTALAASNKYECGIVDLQNRSDVSRVFVPENAMLTSRIIQQTSPRARSQNKDASSHPRRLYQMRWSVNNHALPEAFTDH